LLKNKKKMDTRVACPNCFRGYLKRNEHYDRHVLMCNFMGKTRQKRKQEDNKADSLPSLEEMFTIVVEMTTKYMQLDRKVEEMSRWVETKKRKVDILEWLDNNYMVMPVTYDEWLQQIIITREHLELVFASDYIQGISNILSALLPETSRPLKAFDLKENYIYVYTSSSSAAVSTSSSSADVSTSSSAASQWALLTQEQFHKLLNILSRGLMDHFIEWQKENRHRMYSDEFTLIYTTNVKKIMGGHVSREVINNSIKRNLYRLLKVEVHQITEINLSF
jgi:hypothetical protein